LQVHNNTVDDVERDVYKQRMQHEEQLYPLRLELIKEKIINLKANTRFIEIQCNIAEIKLKKLLNENK